MAKFSCFAVSIFLFFNCVDQPQRSQKATSKDPVTGELGDSAMVASAHPLASAVGVEILRAGGNAIDAAIAMHFALAVVYPSAGNIGGGGFALIREHSGTTSALDFREKAPAASTKNMYLDENGEIHPAKLSLAGRLACGVPGSVDGMFKLHQRFGTMNMEQLLQPAILLADEGFALTAREANKLNQYQEEFRKHNTWTLPTVREKSWQEGDSIFYRELAVTLALIRDFGRDGFYEGIVADQIVKEVKKEGGLITMQDLASYQSIWREPIIGEYRGYKIISMSPPSSGGVALIQLLAGTEPYPIDEWGHNQTRTIHLMTELERRVYADRSVYLGDPDHYKVPIKTLLSTDYIKSRFSDISLTENTSSKDVRSGELLIVESEETTHFSVVDADRNAIAITTTINSSFGNKVMVKGAGFFLNNEMNDFSIKPGAPNQFGLIGGEANAVQPGKRMLSSMTPTIVEKEGELFMILGTPGGSTIITSVYQTILNVIDHGMTMQDAVNAKKIHHQWLPDSITVEDGAITEEVRQELENLGHRLKPRRSIGRLDCILVLPDGRLEGASDITRGDNRAIGY